VTLQKLLLRDEEISRSLRVLENNHRLKPIAAVFAHSGDSWFWLAGLILIAAFGDSFWKPWALIMIFSLLVLAVFVLALKFLIRRRRPEGEWGKIYRATDPHSFPSGHAARAFLFAVLAIGLGPAWLAWIMAIWAPLVSMARVMMGVHYLSDVVAGVIIGIIFGIVILILIPVYEPVLVTIIRGILVNFAQ
jgi:membrane-associated phospholipid phosphatase